MTSESAKMATALSLRVKLDFGRANWWPCRSAIWFGLEGFLPRSKTDQQATEFARALPFGAKPCGRATAQLGNKLKKVNN